MGQLPVVRTWTESSTPPLLLPVLWSAWSSLLYWDMMSWEVRMSLNMLSSLDVN